MSVEGRKRRTSAKQRLDTSSWTEEERRAHHQKQMLEVAIAEMNLSVRIINTLEDNNIIHCKDLMRQNWESLMKMRNFGEKTFTECKAAILELGLTPPNWKPPSKSKRLVKPRKQKKKKDDYIQLR